VADVAKKAGVEHFVYSSVAGVERNSGIGHWATKWEIEQHIRKLGLPATMIRPVSFMEDYYIEQVEIGCKSRLSRYCWRTPKSSRSLSECNKWWNTSLRKRSLRKPCCGSHEIECSSNKKVKETGFRQADIARSPEIPQPDPL
jgi:hypothetical protein